MNTDRFKFRVWENSTKQYLNDEKFLLPSGELGFFIRSMGYPHHRIFNNQDFFTIEQCTGLKDKNGKLIFEGDVISRNNGRWKEIRFYQGGFGWWTEYDCFVSFSGHNHLEEVLQTHEIIGNIHGDQFREVTKMVDGKDVE